MMAQHSEIRLYSGGSSTLLATARYRKVKIPVDAIPMLRMRAPEANDSCGGVLPALPEGPAGWAGSGPPARVGVDAELTRELARGASSTGTASGPRSPRRSDRAGARTS